MVPFISGKPLVHTDGDFNMKNFLASVAIAALVLAPVAAAAQQLIVGTGTTSASSSGLSVIGSVGSAAAFGGIAFSTLSAVQNQSSSGFAFGATNGLVSFSTTGTTATGGSSSTSVSGAAGNAIAGGGAAVTSINGSDAQAFAGFGFTFP